jgi:hypothetical protein
MLTNIEEISDTKQLLAMAEEAVADDVRQTEEDIAKVSNLFAEKLETNFPSGLVGVLAEHIMGEMRRPQPAMALCCAMSIVSFLSENRYTIKDWGTRLNLYQLVIGFTGAGKDAVYSEFWRIIKHVGYHGAPRESITSGAALQRLLSEESNVYLFKDEVWEMMENINSCSGNSHMRELTSVMMSLYSKGGSTYGGKAFSNPKDNIDPIDNPFVNFVGATTPARFVSALSQSQVDDGFLNRMVVYKSETVPPLQTPKGAELNQKALSILRTMQTLNSPDRPGMVVIESDAAITFKALAIKSDTNLINPSYGSLWSRAHENALRLAGVVAIGQDIRTPVITRVTARWACELIEEQLNDFTGLLEEGMSENSFEASAKKALKYIQTAKKYTSDSKYSQQLKLGLMPRSKLMKLMRLPSPELFKVTEYLLGCGDIEIDDTCFKPVVARL